MKHILKVKYYARYTDDFVVISDSKDYLLSLITEISLFLDNELKLTLHPRKIEIRKYSQGVDFLGYVVFPYHTLVRKRTIKRVRRKLNIKMKLYREDKIDKIKLDATLMSYLGVLAHANTYRFSEQIKNEYFLSANND